MKKLFTRMTTVSLLCGALLCGNYFSTKDTYAAGLDGDFPTAYKTALEKLSKENPEWTFKAVETGLKWDDVIAAESSNNRSLLAKKTSSGLILSKATGDFSITSGDYIYKDGSVWVSASKPAVAYYMDPRNFLTKEYIFMNEALNFSAEHHKLTGVEAILKGTDLSNKKITYTDTSGNTKNLDITYGEAIFNAGKTYGISPLFLAARIKQETGASLSNNSISGKYKYNGVSYVGYYNYYNIGATSTGSGTAVTRGLDYAKKSGWTTPVKAIEGGASFLTSSYIKKGQNTGYFQKFNVVASPFYSHQYMQNLTAAATEANSTYNAYNKLGVVDSGYVFYIPVYKNMPSLSSKVKITKSVKKGKTTGNVNMRSGPSTSYGKVLTDGIPKGATVTLDGAKYSEATSISSQLANPYWYKVTYSGKTGYVSAEYIKANTDFKLKAKGTKQLKVTTGSGEKIYYQSSNPVVADVNNSGLVTARTIGSCEIYAMSSSGRTMDVVGLEVYDDLKSPTLQSISNTSTGIKVSWSKVTGATQYYVYRKTSSTSWSKIKTITSGSTTSYIDTSVKAGETYTYTVIAHNDNITSSYDAVGKTYKYIPTPTVNNITTTKTEATVKWKKIDDAKSYYVYRKTDTSNWEKVKTIEGNSVVEYKDKNLKSGTNYYYSVVAYNEPYESYFSEKGILATTIPDSVSIKNVTNSSGGVTITWDKIDRADGYYICRKLTEDDSWVKIGTVKSVKTDSYKDTTVSSSKKYIYSVQAYKGKKTSAYDDKYKEIMYLSVPSLKSVITTTSTAKITWSKVTGAKGYYIYRKTSSTSWKKIADIKSGSTVSYTNKSLLAKTTYYYTVRAYNGKYISSYVKNGIKATTKTKYSTYVTTTKVNYRTGAGMKYKTVGTLAKGKKISVEQGYSKKVDGYTWYRFKINDKTYYIVSKYIKKV